MRAHAYRSIVRRVERAKRAARKQAREAAKAGIFHGDAIHRRVVTQFRVRLRRR